MTGNDNMAAASNAMPRVPLPPPKPALDHLPAELIRNIVTYIPGSRVHELFALRRTCRFYRSVATDFLRPYMRPKLRRIRVLLTKEGLTAFLELMSVPNWRRCIECLEFIDPGVDAIAKERKGKQDIYRWLGYEVVSAQLQTIQNKVTPAQHLFWVEQAPVLLKEIFSALKTIRGLQDVHFGAKGRVHRPVLGLRHFVKNMDFDYVHTLLSQWHVRQHIDNREIGTYLPAVHTRLLHQVMLDTGFDKDIIHLNVRNVAGTGGCSLPGVWPYVEHPSFRKLNILDMDHALLLNSIMALSTMSLYAEMERLTPPQTYWNITELRLVGCKSDSRCIIDTETFSLLTKADFPQLIRLELSGYAVTSDKLIAFLQGVKATARDIVLTKIHLTSGSWKPILQALCAFERLRGFKVKTLSEMIQRANGRFEKHVGIAMSDIPPGAKVTELRDGRADE